MVLEDQDDEVELEPDRRLQLLAVHHEAAVAADGHDAAFGIEHAQAIMAEGRPAPIVASALSSSSVFATRVR